MDEAEYCNRISIMVDGRIEALGTPKQLKKDFKTETIEELFVQLARNAKND
jgi:ABC-2 type transport system ATP-binding protein